MEYRYRNFIPPPRGVLSARPTPVNMTLSQMVAEMERHGWRVVTGSDPHGRFMNIETLSLKISVRIPQFDTQEHDFCAASVYDVYGKWLQQWSIVGHA